MSKTKKKKNDWTFLFVVITHLDLNLLSDPNPIFYKVSCLYRKQFFFSDKSYLKQFACNICCV